MATLPASAHGDILPIVKIVPKYEGRGEARHIVGTQLTALLLFDNCAHAPITILGLDAAKLPSPQMIAEHNMKLDFLKVRFTDLAITYRGGEYGTVIYNGTANGAEVLAPGK